MDLGTTYSAKEYAKHLGVSPAKVQAWIAAKELRAIDVRADTTAGKPQYRIKPADAAAFEAGRATTSAERCPSRRRGPRAANTNEVISFYA